MVNTFLKAIDVTEGKKKLHFFLDDLANLHLIFKKNLLKILT